MNRQIDKKIAFIGCGNMAKCIISGICSSKVIDTKNIYATRRNLDSLNEFARNYAIHISNDNYAVIELCDIIFLCVKPHQIKSLCVEINKQNFSAKIFICIAAGISCKKLSQWLDKHYIIRAMPNICIEVKEGVCALTTCNHLITDKDKQIINAIFSSLSKVYWLKNDEELDVITLIAGSAPAYFYYVAQAILNKAKEYPINEDLKKDILLQTILGAALLAKSKKLSFDELISQIMSPNGVTHAAIEELKNHQADKIFFSMLDKANQKNIALSKLD